MVQKHQIRYESTSSVPCSCIHSDRYKKGATWWKTKMMAMLGSMCQQKMLAVALLQGLTKSHQLHVCAKRRMGKCYIYYTYIYK